MGTWKDPVNPVNLHRRQLSLAPDAGDGEEEGGDASANAVLQKASKLLQGNYDPLGILPATAYA